jgi:hypothetical protein
MKIQITRPQQLAVFRTRSFFRASAANCCLLNSRVGFIFPGIVMVMKVAKQGKFQEDFPCLE